MNKKLLWIIALACLTLFLLFWHTCVQPFDFSDLFEAIGFISISLTTLIFAALLALPVALLPYQKLGYVRKLGLAYPLSLTGVCLVFGLSFYATGPHYHAIQAQPGTDCSSVKDGVFRLGDLLIERHGLIQIQTDMTSGQREEFTVRWLGDCEYELNGRDGSLSVKIVSVSKDGYECYTLLRGRTSKRFTLIRQGNS